MVTTPARAAAGQDADAHLEIIRPLLPEDQRIVPLRFNPTEYQLAKANTFAEVPIPGLESPLLQYVRGGSETLSLDALVDTSHNLEDVRKRYVNRLRGLMTPDSKEHAPPLIRFVWGGPVLTGVLESLNVTYLLFAPGGVPLRARLAMSLKEYRTAQDQVNDPPRSSPTVHKSYVVRRGDTLASISASVYRSPGFWRELALANAIDDPRRLDPGRILTVPPLDR